LFGYVSRQFGNAWAVQDISPLAVKIPMPKQKDVDEVVEILRKAQRPLILLGSQATLGPIKAEKLAELVKVCFSSVLFLKKKGFRNLVFQPIWVECAEGFWVIFII